MLSLTQISTPSFALLSYIITESESGESFVIDPPSDLGSKIDLASLTVKAVINTHIHPDHTMGNHLFAGKAPILAHREEGGPLRRMTSSSLTALFTARIPPKISFSLSEGEDLYLGDTAISVLHTPGHSPGSICLLWEGNLVSGDTVFIEGIGRTDMPGGSSKQMKKSIHRILALPGGTMIWPGHSYGGKFSATLEEISPFLSQILTII